MLSSLLTITATVLFSGVTALPSPHNTPPPGTLPTYFNGRCQIGLIYCQAQVDMAYEHDITDNDYNDLRNVFICYRDGDISDGIEKPNKIINYGRCPEGTVCQVKDEGYGYRCAYGDNGRGD